MVVNSSVETRMIILTNVNGIDANLLADKLVTSTQIKRELLVLVAWRRSFWLAHAEHNKLVKSMKGCAVGGIRVHVLGEVSQDWLYTVALCCILSVSSKISLKWWDHTLFTTFNQNNSCLIQVHFWKQLNRLQHNSKLYNPSNYLMAASWGQPAICTNLQYYLLWKYVQFGNHDQTYRTLFNKNQAILLLANCLVTNEPCM